MNRRSMLLALVSSAMAACAPRVSPVACDPELATALDRALRSRGGRLYRIDALAPRPLLAAAEAGGVIVVTREPKLADRLQRQGAARLQNRWALEIDGRPAHMVVTTGEGDTAAIHLAKWLASDEAAGALTSP